MTTTLSLPGLERVRDTSCRYGDPRHVYLDALSRYPDAVLDGMRRELTRLEHAGIPAYADGRRVWTPKSSFLIELTGHPSRWITSVVDFNARARHAAQRMETCSGYSFNRTFRSQYFQEDTNHA